MLALQSNIGFLCVQTGDRSLHNTHRITPVPGTCHWTTSTYEPATSVSLFSRASTTLIGRASSPGLLREWDLNPRPPDYESGELPTALPRCVAACVSRQAAWSYWDSCTGCDHSNLYKLLFWTNLTCRLRLSCLNLLSGQVDYLLSS